jgi:pyridoxamine 5'-phosphate oxidase
MNKIPGWRLSLVSALERNRHFVYSRYFQLATVGLDSRPANRTVVFRGFLPHTNQLQMITDSRSQKVNQISNHSWGEICWYFPETREQFRLLGQLKLISDSHPDLILTTARTTIWQFLSNEAKQQFYWPDCRQPRSESTAFNPLTLIPLEPPSNFILLLLEPQEVDHLDLQGKPQNRTLYSYNSEQGWLTEIVNP